MRYYQDIQAMVKGKQVFCALDVHKSSWNVCTVIEGEVLEQTHMKSEYRQLKSMLEGYQGAANLQIVYEAGFSGFWLYRQLVADGYDCMVTPPSHTPRRMDKVKTDRRDAQKLARYLEAGLLKAVYVPPKSVESDRGLLRRRAQRVGELTRLKSYIRGFLNHYGIQKPSGLRTCWSQRYLFWLRSLEFEESSAQFTLNNMLDNYDRLAQELREFQDEITRLSQKPDYCGAFQYLTSLRGVGLITAMTFLLELYDLKRFRTADRLSSYLGLTPSQHSSGSHVRMGRITRHGNAQLRKLLIESAWWVIRHDASLGAKYTRLIARGKNKKQAIVAVARNLAIRLRRCILDQTDYQISEN